MTNPTHSQEQDLRTALEAELAELHRANDAATRWGAAVGARAERIAVIDRQLAGLRAAPPRPVDAERVAPKWDDFTRVAVNTEAEARIARIEVDQPFAVSKHLSTITSHVGNLYDLTDDPAIREVAVAMKACAVDAVEAALASPAHSPDKAADEDARLSLSGNPMPPDGIEGCCICGEAFKEGDMVLIEVNEGEAHVACCGPERDGYVNLDTGEPIGPDEPIPAGYPWSAHSPDKGVDRSIPALRLRQDPIEVDAGLIEDYEAGALTPKPAGTEAGRGVETDWPGVDGHIVQAARDLCAERRGQPEWLWFENEHGRVSFGRWPRLATMAPYVRADIPLAATPTPPVSPTPGSTGPAGALPNLPEGWSYVRNEAGELRVQAPAGLVGEPHAALTPSAPIAAPGRDDGALTLAALHAANAARQTEWCQGGDAEPDLAFRGNELAGETGEACNVIKKLERERHGWRGSRATLADLAEELADVVICADLCAVTAGIDLGAAVVAKFNATSNKVGISVRLPTPAPDVPGDAQTQEGGR